MANVNCLRMNMQFRHFIPCPAFKGSAGAFLINASPLLKKEMRIEAFTLIKNLVNPIDFKRS